MGEYITEEALEKLKMAFKSLGERLGFVSAGDVRRAREMLRMSMFKEDVCRILKLTNNIPQL